MGLSELPIIPYRAERIPNPMPGGLTWQQYHSVRNLLFSVCQKHGSTGPMGPCPIDADRSEPDFDRWKPAADDPVYYLIDDQYNDDRYLYVHVKPEGMTQAWLADVVEALRSFPGWGLCVTNLQGAYIIVFGNRILVTGNVFDNCTSLADLVAAAQAALNKST